LTVREREREKEREREMQAYYVEQSPSWESSLPYSPEPATCPCPKSSESSPHPTMLVIKIRFNIIFSVTRILPNWFSSSFPPQNSVVFLLSPYVPHASPISSLAHAHSMVTFCLSSWLTNKSPRSCPICKLTKSLGPSVERKTVCVTYRDVIVRSLSQV